MGFAHLRETTKARRVVCVQLLLTILQLALICPFVPVSGLMLPMLIMDATKLWKKVLWLPAKLLTMETVEAPLAETSDWSDWRSPWLFCRLGK